VKKVAALIIIAVLAAGLIAWMVRAPKNEPETKYLTVPLEKGTLRAEINSSGTLKPMVEVLVGSQVSGTIKALYADFESQVTKGQLIALIDPDMFQAKAEQANADLEAAKAALVKAEVTAADELISHTRNEGLIKQQSISQSEYDKSKARLDAAQAQVLVEKAKVVQMKAKRDEMELQLRYCRIEAPVSGAVVARNMDVGQTVTASFQTPVLFKIAEDLSRMQVHTNVDEADIGRVRVEQSATFTVPAFPDEQFTASVTQIRNDPKIEQNVVTYNVILDVDNRDQKLRPGMTASVTILLSEVKDALIAPEQAFRFTPPVRTTNKDAAQPKLPELKAGERRLWKLEGEDEIRPVTVRTGVSGIEKVQVFSDELKPGDRLVVDVIQNSQSAPKSRAIRFRF
jgi:HlyD family secretion protein